LPVGPKGAASQVALGLADDGTIAKLMLASPDEPGHEAAEKRLAAFVGVSGGSERKPLSQPKPPKAPRGWKGDEALADALTAAFPIVDFVAFIHQSRLSGTLTVSVGGIDRSISFADGEVRSAQSDAVGERIGEVAVRLGYISKKQLEEAMKAGRPVGKHLVEK